MMHFYMRQWLNQQSYRKLPYVSMNILKICQYINFRELNTFFNRFNISYYLFVHEVLSVHLANKGHNKICCM